MENKENVKNIDDKRTELFEMAHRDPSLKKELIRDPRAVADRFGVKFSDQEIQELQKLSVVSELVQEVKYGRLFPRPPIFYPVRVWQINDLLDIFTQLIPSDFVGTIGPGPVFYPADIGQQMGGSMTRAGSWVSYPGDEGGGGGGGRWKGGSIFGGGVVPGPIFYPARLRNFMKERLIQILQVKQQYNR